MRALHTFAATQLILEMAAGHLGAEELLDSVLERIGTVDPVLGAYLTIDEEGARAAARLADRRRAAGEPAGPLSGVPVAVKDNICTEELRTTCSSRMLEGFVPPYDATVVRRLRLAGAVLVGKTNMDEFGMGSSCEHAALGTTLNPWDTTRVPGGSSGGSAVALAAGLAPLALGSDTGGSIRLPAALTGVVGLKPTYGRVSRYGLIAYGSSLDQIGPMGRNVTDCALLMEVIAGYDSRDATSLSGSCGALREGLEDGVRGLRIGVPREYWDIETEPEVRTATRAALEQYRGMGARIVDVSLPSADVAISCYIVVATSEASSNLARYDGMHYGHRASQGGELADLTARSRGEGFGPEVKRRILLGAFALSAGYRDQYYTTALRVRRQIKDEFDAAFEAADVLVAPTAPFSAFVRGARTSDPMSMYACDVLTVGASLAGLPALSLPCGLTSGGLPIGLQLIGRQTSEALLLRTGRALERELTLADRVAEPVGMTEPAFETVIGLEVHVQLSTETKLFCGCPTTFGQPPNSQVCPICLGLPGILPVVNEQAFRFAVQTALALDCEIAGHTKFDRKHYYYPDLPKNFQISQYDMPFATGGRVSIDLDEGTKEIRLVRIHIEEDAGKMIHTDAGTSQVDLNRAGTPLLEIVSEPDLRSPTEAHQYLRELKQILEYLAVSDCNMEQGSLRCDCNVSIRPVGSEALGVKTEIKNLNSFRAVERAAEYEARRQVGLVLAGAPVTPETMQWDETVEKTTRMRSKETIDDYRYFPEPDLGPVRVSREWVAQVRTGLPELPRSRRERFVRKFGLPATDAGLLAHSRPLGDYFEAICEASSYADPKLVANWVADSVLRYLNEHHVEISAYPLQPHELAELLDMVASGRLTGAMAKSALRRMIDEERSAEDVAAELGQRITGARETLELCRLAIETGAKTGVVEAYRGGKTTALEALVGYAMRESEGKADAQKVRELLESLLADGGEPAS